MFLVVQTELVAMKCLDGEEDADRKSPWREQPCKTVIVMDRLETFCGECTRHRGLRSSALCAPLVIRSCGENGGIDESR